MTQRELFAVLVKAMGLWQFIGGVVMLPNFWSSFAQYDNEAEFFVILLGNFLSYSGLQIVAGCLLFFGADRIAAASFKKNPPHDRP